MGILSKYSVLGGEDMKEKNNPNGLDWFALGFSIASLIAVLLK